MVVFLQKFAVFPVHIRLNHHSPHFQTYTPLGSERKITIVRPDGTKVDDLTAKSADDIDKITGLSQPGYTE